MVTDDEMKDFIMKQSEFGAEQLKYISQGLSGIDIRVSLVNLYLLNKYYEERFKEMDEKEYLRFKRSLESDVMYKHFKLAYEIAVTNVIIKKEVGK